MILGISGKKHSGKNTVANVIHGLALKQMNMIQDWSVDDKGHLNVLTQDGWGVFDVTRKDAQFLQWAEPNLYPYIKMYSFADALKWLAVELFDIPEECCFGTEDQKNQKHEHLRWENMPGIVTDEVTEEEWGYLRLEYDSKEMQEALSKINLTYHAAGPMTAREFLQFFGTDLCRRMWEPIWVNKCIKDIKREGTLLAIIPDVRFPNEVQVIEEAGGMVLRLTRHVFDDDHNSETALDDYSFNQYLDNKNDSIDSTIAKVQRFYRSFLLRNFDDSNIY